ncbi:hypothetical protein [Catenuloplanes japonicus]|uniref:hypothetical protein n=1 Tax=Catenuloplanes japonicus TaxID=33876 RepID=UPI0005267121|nr:hypothetical protein [Catenuloplanes japonicus]
MSAPQHPLLETVVAPGVYRYTATIWTAGPDVDGAGEVTVDVPTLFADIVALQVLRPVFAAALASGARIPGGPVGPVACALTPVGA